MWIAIFFTGIAFFLAHAVWFSARIVRAVEMLFPGARRHLRPARAIYLVVACSLPVLVLAYMVYALAAEPETIGPPDSRLYDLPSRFETPYLTGSFQLGRMTLVVSGGLGMSVAPFRYRAPATLDLVRLRRGR